MRILAFLFAIFLLASVDSNGQQYIEPVAGYRADVNSRGVAQFNTGIQYTFKKNSRYEMMVRVQKNWPLKHFSSDSSFSVNPLLPVYAPAYKTKEVKSWDFSFDQRFILNPAGKNHHFSVLLRLGFVSEKIDVSYKYDKSNYTVLNPEETRSKFSLYIGTGFEYMKLIKDNWAFIQLTLDTPPLGKVVSPSSSFMAPLALNVGYSFKIKKMKHGR